MNGYCPADVDPAEDEERPEGFDFGGYAGFAEIALTQPGLDGALELGRRQPLSRGRPVSGMEMTPALSTEKELLRSSCPNTMTLRRSPARKAIGRIERRSAAAAQASGTCDLGGGDAQPPKAAIARNATKTRK